MRLTAKTRILIGQLGLLASVLITAMMLRVMPDTRTAVLKSRVALCETLAVSSTIFVSQNDFDVLEDMLELIVGRHEHILSAAICQSDGLLVVETEEHSAHWKETESSNDGQVSVPLLRDNEPWGSIQLRFKPLVERGWQKYVYHPWTRLIGFTLIGSALMFYFYLGKMLKHLNPSKAVPQRVRSALDTLAEGLLVLDTKGQIVLANEAFGELVEKPPETLVGRSASEFTWESSDEDVEVELPWTRSLEEQSAVSNSAVSLRMESGEVRNFHVNCSPVLASTGKYRGVLVSFDDVTQLEAQREELAKSKEEADKANRAKSDFLANMSHEIRTPMNAILGFADILRRDYDLDDKEKRRYLSTIHSSGKHLLDLINDILDLSKVESGRLEIDAAACSPHAIISDVVAVLRGRADEKGIRLDYHADAIPETIVSDAGRIRQIVTNLVGNAIKFTEDGGVTIRAQLVEDTEDPLLQIDIQDTGIGLSPEQAARIFDPFVQADASVTRRFGGTGLGLSISRRLTRALGGDLTVHSEAGQGSTFSVTLETGPLEGVEIASSDTLEAKRQQQPVAPAAVSRNLPAVRILLADDGPANRELLSLVLGRAGAEIDQAENGQIAVQLATRRSYDVVLMDMQMPVMDGFTATSILRERIPDLPIIALTADAMIGAEERCVEVGCTAFVPKPIDMDQLFRCLKDILQLAEEEPEAATAEDHNVVTDRDAERTDEPNDGVPNDVRPDNAEPEDAQTTEGKIPIAQPPTDASTHDSSVLAPLSKQTRAKMGLPEDNTQYREMMETFLSNLHDQLEGMIGAVQREDYAALAELAHSLRGSAPMFGYDMFAEPAHRLEEAAREEASIDEIRRTVAELIEMSERVLLPMAHADDASEVPTVPSPPPVESATRELNDIPPVIRSSLPLDDPDFLRIVVGFVEHLGNQVNCMHAAWNARDYAELEQLAHWLKGAGGTLGFEIFSEPARELQDAASERTDAVIEDSLTRISEMARRIQVPAETTSDSAEAYNIDALR